MEGFQKWLNEVGEVNHCRGGLTIDGDLVLEGGTALHWAAYYGKCTLGEKLIEKGAGWIDFCDIMYVCIPPGIVLKQSGNYPSIDIR